MSKKNTSKLFSIIALCGCVFYYSQAIAQENTETPTVTVTEAENTGKNEQSEIIVYTWTDFLTNKDCRSLTKSLATQSEYKDLHQSLNIYCNSSKISAWEELLNTFRKEKKKIMINQTLKSDSSYIRYIKVIPHYLFDIQNIKATGNQPKAVLDQMEQAIIDRQLDTIMSLQSTLPETWQKGFKNTNTLIDKLQQLREQLNHFNEQEDNND